MVIGESISKLTSPFTECVVRSEAASASNNVRSMASESAQLWKQDRSHLVASRSSICSL